MTSALVRGMTADEIILCVLRKEPFISAHSLSGWLWKKTSATNRIHSRPSAERQLIYNMYGVFNGSNFEQTPIFVESGGVWYMSNTDYLGTHSNWIKQAIIGALGPQHKPTPLSNHDIHLLWANGPVSLAKHRLTGGVTWEQLYGVAAYDD